MTLSSLVLSFSSTSPHLQGQQCIFMETAMHLRSARPHAIMECVPCSERELDRAPAYFKKAMLEAESEWSTHHAKAVIDTTAKKVKG